MTFDEQLATRIRHALREDPDITERKMFGGLAFLWRGRMSCGIVGSDLMVRVPLDEFENVLQKPNVRPMDFTGRPLKGFVYVSPLGFRTATALGGWLACARRGAAANATEKRRPRPITRQSNQATTRKRSQP